MAITLTRAAMQDEFRYPEFIGLSTDGYPSSDDPAVVNGAEVYFMDTQKRYKYDIDNDAWYEVPAEGGGGGGGGGTDNYLLLSNRPKINGVLLNVNNDSANLHLKYTDLETDTKPSINGQKLEGNLSLPQLGITYTNLTEKPRINNVLLQGNMSLDDIGISKSYNALTNKPAVNGVTLDGNKTADELGLTYPNITDKPSVNGVTLEGNKTSDDLGIVYPNLSQKPKINGVTVNGNISSKTDLGITYNNFDTSDKPAVNNVTLQSGNNTLEALDIRKASESYNKDEIDDLIASARSIRVLETMPASPERNTLYYIGVAPDYDVYLCDTTGLVVNMGTSAVALDQYQKKSDNTLTTAAKTVVGGINEVHNDVLQRVKTADVVNNLSTSSSTKVLSAAMGVQLQDNKVEIAGSGLVKTNVTLNHADNIEPKTDAYVGSETVIPRLKYNSTGHLVSVSTATVYPPTTPGTAGQVWVSRGIGQGEWKDADIGGGGDYNLLNNRPRINGVLMEGNKSTADLGIKYETLPDRPSISGNVISGDKTPAQLGITYPALDTKPSVNGVTLQGNKTTADLKIKYQDTIDKPTINDIEFGQTNTGEDLKLVDLEYTDPDKMGKFILVDDDGFVQYTAPKVNDNDMKWDENTSHDLGIIWDGTKEEYDLITDKNPETLYFVDKKKVYLNEEVVADLSDGGIVDVDELPTANISFGVIYRMIKDVYQFLNRYELDPNKLADGWVVDETGVTDSNGINHSWVSIVEDWTNTEAWFVENTTGSIWRYIYDEKTKMEFTTTEPAHPWKITLNMRCKNDVEGEYWQEFYSNTAPVGGGSGVNSYVDLLSKPSINGVTITGNKTSTDYGIVVNLTQAEYDAISDPNPETLYCIVDGNDTVKESDYMNLINRPSIEGILLRPNMTFADLDLMTKSQIEAKLTSINAFSGSVNAKTDLPNNAKVGDVYYVKAENANFAWNGSMWSNVGGTVDMTAYQMKQSSVPLETTSQTIEGSLNELAVNKQPKIDDALETASKSVVGAINGINTIVGNATLTTSAQTVTEAINELRNGNESVDNKVTVINDSATHTQYPSAKAVYNARTKMATKPIYGSADVNGFQFKNGEIDVIDTGDSAYLYATVKVTYATTTNITNGFDKPIPVLYYDSAKTSTITAKADYPCAVYVNSTVFGVFECLYASTGLPNAKWKAGSSLTTGTTIHLEFSGLVNRANYDAVYNV